MAEEDLLLPPRTEEAATLEAALQDIAREKAEDKDVAADLEIQGGTQPDEERKNDFRDWMCSQGEPMVLVGIMDGMQVLPIHSIIKYIAPGRTRDVSHMLELLEIEMETPTHLSSK
jgi:hypothetical protein